MDSNRTEEAREFLKQIVKLEILIKNKKIEKKLWRDIATGTSAQICGERVQSSGSQHKMEDAADKELDIELQIERGIEEYKKVKRDVLNVIEQLKADEYDFLHKAYIQNLTFNCIAQMNSKSYSWTTTIHKRALNSVQDILDERKRRKV